MSDKLPTADSLRSLIGALGDPERDKIASTRYYDTLLSDDQLLHAFRNSWIARKAVTIPALDACRKWRNWQADQADITRLEATEKRLGLQQKVLQCKTLARLWGGAAIVIGVDGQSPDQPFDPESVGKDKLAYLTVMSRRELVAGEMDQDPLNEWYGRPKDYQVSNGRAFSQVHPSRIVYQVGEFHPDPLLVTGPNVGWGDSTLQVIYSAMVNSDATNANIASLIFEASVDVIAVPELMEHMSSAPYRQKLLDRFTLAAAGKSINKTLLLDGEEVFTTHAKSFANLDNLMQQFILFVAGAADIPLTRFLGQSPAGMSSTGDGDMKNYHDRIQSIQTLDIQPSLWRLDEALIRSSLGKRPDEMFYTWAPLEQMSEKEKAEIAKLQAETVNIITGTGLFMQEELREVYGNQLVEEGYFPGLADLLKQNGNDLPEWDLEARKGEAGAITAEAGAEAAVRAAKEPVEKDARFGDATPRTLYLRRDVVNTEEILEWYREQGVEGLYAAESLHVTIAYSKQPLDWMKLGEPWSARLEIAPGGPRLHELFGPENNVLVLQFASMELNWRAQAVVDAGGVSEHGEYQSHISLSLQGDKADLATLRPYMGKIVLGPEVFEETKEGDWKASVKTNE